MKIEFSKEGFMRIMNAQSGSEARTIDEFLDRRSLLYNGLYPGDVFTLKQNLSQYRVFNVVSEMPIDSKLRGRIGHIFGMPIDGTKIVSIVVSDSQGIRVQFWSEACNTNSGK